MLELITLNTILFLLVIIAIAILIKRTFTEEILTPDIVATELYPLIDMGERLRQHFKTYLTGKRILGEGELTILPGPGDGVVTLTLSTEIDLEYPEGRIKIFMTLLFFRVDSPTEVAVGDLVTFKGILRDFVIRGEDYFPMKCDIELFIEISELTYVSGGGGKGGVGGA